MRHRNRSLALLFLALLVLPRGAHATASLIGPAHDPGTEAKRSGLDVGFRASGAHATGKSGEGVDPSYQAGASLVWRRTRTVGIGVALDYCRWRWPSAGLELDRIFSALSQSPIHGTAFTLSGLRGTVFVKQMFLPEAVVVPWLQAGGGLCRSNSKFVLPAAQLQNAGWEVSDSGTRSISYDPMLAGGVGLDVKLTPSMRIGFDLQGEVVYLKDAPDPFTAVTVGGHLLFGNGSH